MGNISVPTACLFLELCFCWANFGGKTSGREKAADGFTWEKVQCPKEDLNDGSAEGKSLQIGKSTLGKPYARGIPFNPVIDSENLLTWFFFKEVPKTWFSWNPLWTSP